MAVSIIDFAKPRFILIGCLTIRFCQTRLDATTAPLDRPYFEPTSDHSGHAMSAAILRMMYICYLLRFCSLFNLS